MGFEQFFDFWQGPKTTEELHARRRKRAPASFDPVKAVIPLIKLGMPKWMATDIIIRLRGHNVCYDDCIICPTPSVHGLGV